MHFSPGHVLVERHSLASSLGQSSDCFAILRNLLNTHTPFPIWRPSGAWDLQIVFSE